MQCENAYTPSSFHYKILTNLKSCNCSLVIQSESITWKEGTVQLTVQRVLNRKIWRKTSSERGEWENQTSIFKRQNGYLSLISWMGGERWRMAQMECQGQLQQSHLSGRGVWGLNSWHEYENMKHLFIKTVLVSIALFFCFPTEQCMAFFCNKLLMQTFSPCAAFLFLGNKNCKEERQGKKMILK